MVAAACCYAGPVADGEAALQPLRDFDVPAADVVAPIPYTLLQALFDATSPPGTHAYWKTEYLADLTHEAVDVLVDAAAKIPDSTGSPPFTSTTSKAPSPSSHPAAVPSATATPGSCSTSSGCGWTTTTPTPTSAGCATPGTASDCTPPATPTSTSWATSTASVRAAYGAEPSGGSWSSGPPTTPKTSFTSTKTSRPIPSTGSGTRIPSEEDDRPDRRSCWRTSSL
jgi:hypothetical protein